MAAQGPVTDTSSNKLGLLLNLKVIVPVLLAVIAGMLIIWKPWVAANNRTIEITGEAKLKATPDEFIFSPTYRFPSADKDAAIAELAKKSEAVVAGLKKLGVPENKIKTSTGDYDSVYIGPSRGMPAAETNFTTQLTVTVSEQALAQKVQDYLLTTAPTGAITPQPTFSDKLRKELEAQARDIATKDAKGKAEQMASNLGFRLGKVKAVSDSAGIGVVPLGSPERAVSSDKSSLTLHPGENDLYYAVRVTYFIR